MNVQPSVSAAEKAELLSFFDAPVSPAPRRRHRIGMLVQHIRGWQEDRRRALHLLRASRESALARREYDQADAYLWASMVIEAALRERASAAIAEGCSMAYAHLVVPS